MRLWLCVVDCVLLLLDFDGLLLVGDVIWRLSSLSFVVVCCCLLLVLFAFACQCSLVVSSLAVVCCGVL